MAYRDPCSFAAAAGFALAAAAAAATPEQIEFFERDIRPLLVEQCSACHGEHVQTGGLALDTPEAFYRGGDSGPVFSEHDPASSRLLAAVRYEGDIKMPPTGKLPVGEIAALARWIEMGAPWPGARAVTVSPSQSASPEWTAEQTGHWSFQPVRPHQPPAVMQEEWVRTPVDRFILAKLERHGLAPPSAADDLTLLRRAKYDLHGLPPTEAEIETFLADTAPGAYARLVDRLLGSPRYGEKWGRHWLDIARYADSTGLDDDIKLPHTWRYRDYVIDAWNRDTPYDQFIVEQLAGDHLPPGGAEAVNRKGIIATGFLAVGTKPLVQQDKVKMKYDVIDEQIDTTGKVFMALTVGCARCHDHKFDPIATKDYYSLAGIYASARNFASLDPAMTVSKVHFEPLVAEEVYRRYRDHQDRIGHVKRRVKSIIDLERYRYVLERRSSRLADYMVAAHEVYASGADAAIVGDREGLDCEVLQLWAEYLEPGDDLRLHLKEWHEAGDHERAATAAEYQRRFRARGEDWIAQLAAWRVEIEGWDGAGEFPEGPDLAPGVDRFFSEVTLSAAGMDEGARRADGPFAIPNRLVDAILPPAAGERVADLRKQQTQLEESALPEPPMAYAVGRGESVEQRVFVRGNHNQPGEPAPRQFPAILAGEDQQPVPDSEGRLRLAEWIASGDHPLTGRVIVNRLWHWHFGEGLVRTPNNFGLMGERPSHPELLDYMAGRFVADGWSLKAMHRLIMLSSAYRSQSTVTDEAWAEDPSNRLWSRFSRRRLTVEEMRDALLGVDSSLDLAMGGALTDSLDSYGFKNAYLHPDDTRRRTVYLPIYRNRLPGLLTLFDFADPSASIAARSKTSIAPQWLYFMNSDFVHVRAASMASHLLTDRESPDRERVKRAYRLALTREARPREVDEAVAYMAQYPVADDADDERLERWRSFCRLLLGSNEFNHVN